MYGYLLLLKNKDNMDEVAKLLACFTNETVMTNGAVEYRLRQLEKIKEMGEEEVYEKIREKLMKDSAYSKYLT